MTIIDCHAHLSAESPQVIQDELERARLAGIVGIVNVCTTLQELEIGLALSKQTMQPKIYTAASTTPHDVTKADEKFIKQIEAYKDQLVAIGETGLDYYYEHSPRKEQQESFCAYIELAIRVNLPLVIHCRDAFEDLFAIFSEYKNLPDIMLHCFTGTKEEAKKAQNLGFYISLSGIVTFSKSKELQEVAACIPDELLLLETDAPYLAPQSRRGKKNEPSFITETLECVAKLRNVSKEALMIATSLNAKKLFRLI